MITPSQFAEAFAVLNRQERRRAADLARMADAFAERRRDPHGWHIGELVVAPGFRLPPCEATRAPETIGDPE